MSVQQTRTFDTYIVGLNDLLKDLRKLPKEATTELRAASRVIAEQHMAPAWRDAARNYAGPWGDDIADTVRTGSDRLPVVKIGSNKRTLSGGASPTMVRYPSDKGDRGRAGQGAKNRMPKAFGHGTDWIERTKGYEPKALQEWSEAVDRVVRKWNY